MKCLEEKLVDIECRDAQFGRLYRQYNINT